MNGRTTNTYTVPAEFLAPLLAGAVIVLDGCTERLREKLRNEGERKHHVWMIGPETTEKHRRASRMAESEAAEAHGWLAEASALIVALEALEGDGETYEVVGAPEAVREAALAMAQDVLPKLLEAVQSYTPFMRTTMEGTDYVLRALRWAQAVSMGDGGGDAR